MKKMYGVKTGNSYNSGYVTDFIFKYKKDAIAFIKSGKWHPSDTDRVFNFKYNKKQELYISMNDETETYRWSKLIEFDIY